MELSAGTTGQARRHSRILAGHAEKDLATTRVLVKELGHIVDLAVDNDPKSATGKREVRLVAASTVSPRRQRELAAIPAPAFRQRVVERVSMRKPVVDTHWRRRCDSAATPDPERSVSSRPETRRSPSCSKQGTHQASFSLL